MAIFGITNREFWKGLEPIRTLQANQNERSYIRVAFNEHSYIRVAFIYHSKKNNKVQPH